MSDSSGPPDDRPDGEARLAGIAALSSAVLAAESAAEVATRTVEHAADRLGLPCTTVLYYDGATGQLTPAARTPDGEQHLPTDSLRASPDGPLWEAFVTDEPCEVSVPADDSRLTDVLAVPLGGTGVLLTGTSATDGFTEFDRQVARTVASVVGNAAARTDRNRRLAECEATLATRTDMLDRFRSLIRMVRDLSQTLIGTTARPEIESVVTEHLVRDDQYEMALVCHHDSVTGETVPAEWAGDQSDTLEIARALVDADADGNGPIHRAAESRTPQVVTDIADEQPFTPWHQVALTRGYRACLVLPLGYKETLYGVLVLYSGQPVAFEDLERDVLVELSHIVSHALHADERKRALVRNEVTELEFVVADPNLEIVRLSRSLNCRFVLESLVSTSDGRLRVYFSTRGAPGADVLDFGPELAVTDLQLLSEREEDGETHGFFEATLNEASLSETVLEYGGRPLEIVIEDGTATVTVEVATDVRTFVERFQAVYPESELVAQRSRERVPQTPSEVLDELTETLTDRQLEALQTAYYSGYFESPRTRSASEVAASLGITQPTFSSHLHAAERKLCHRLFERRPLVH